MCLPSLPPQNDWPSSSRRGCGQAGLRIPPEPRSPHITGKTVCLNLRALHVLRSLNLIWKIFPRSQIALICHLPSLLSPRSWSFSGLPQLFSFFVRACVFVPVMVLVCVNYPLFPWLTFHLFRHIFQFSEFSLKKSFFFLL